MTTNKFSILAYELINDKYSKAKYLGIECIMETKTGFINATKFCTEAQKTEKTEDQKEEDEEKAHETRGKKAQEIRGKKAGDGKKRFDNYIANARYKNLFKYMFKYMSSSPGFSGELSNQVTAGDYELWGTYVHPDLLLDLASWISPAAYVKASGIVKNFLVREKEEENMRLKGDKSRLEKMFEESDKRREESDKRREEAEKRSEQMLLKMTQQNEKTHVDLDETKKTLKQMTHQNEKTHIELDETKKTLDQITHQNEKTHVELDKTKITLQRVEARVDLLVEEVVPPAKKVSLHEQFGIMKLNDSEGKRDYKVYCVQTRGVCKARANVLKEYPKAVLIKEIKPNANSKNFLHKLKEKYGSGKNSKIQVSYNFIKLKDGITEEELKNMIDNVVKEALRYGE